jgi:hypothetical protein
MTTFLMLEISLLESELATEHMSETPSVGECRDRLVLDNHAHEAASVNKRKRATVSRRVGECNGILPTETITRSPSAWELDSKELGAVRLIEPQRETIKDAAWIARVD